MKQHFTLLALAGAFALSTAQAQDQLGSNHSPTLAPPDATSSGDGSAADDEKAKEGELAKKLQNPVANLISVPIQNNWDFSIGSANAMRYTANIQPVIPFTLTKDWNLITRTILSVIYAESPVVGGRDAAGLGDVVQSLFLSPKEPLGGLAFGRRAGHSVADSDRQRAGFRQIWRRADRGGGENFRRRK
jgi:hypothetical protein